MNFKSEIGGKKGRRPTPIGKSISIALALRACVRASERSCVREMIPLWLGSGGEICGYPSVRPSVRPGAGPDQKLELFEF